MFLNPWYGQSADQDAAAGDSGTESSENLVPKVQELLTGGWTAHVVQDGRLVYCNHVNQTSSWLPPLENWNAICGHPAMPYGWEAAVDRDGKNYFISHTNKATTYEDPRKENWTEDPPHPREIQLSRDPQLGFGFVAGSEKPVIVRFVTEGGPSVSKLLPGDQIWRINGEDVREAPRDHVIQLVRSSKDSVHLTVCQPAVDNTGRKSALLSAAKRARLKSNPSRVRFAEGVLDNGSTTTGVCNKEPESGIPVMPNVMKVYLENGQTKSFKYDSATTVVDVMNSLQQKLGFRSMDHFALCVEDIRMLRSNKVILLDPADTLARIAAQPGAHHLRCLLRVCFYPRDCADLLRHDPEAFEYLFLQCCNDVVQERFAPELKLDVALRLASLHMFQHALTNKMQAKISVKNIESEYGLERFVAASLLEAMKRKELRKLLTHLMKSNGQLTSAAGQKQLTPVQAKLQYLKIISGLPSYGAKCFSVNIPDANRDAIILISSRFGVSQISDLRNAQPLLLCDIADTTLLSVRNEHNLARCVELRLRDSDTENLQFVLEEKEAEQLVLVLRGYFKLLTGRQLVIHQEKIHWAKDLAPPYHTGHSVEPSPWSFVDPEESDGEKKRTRFVDLSLPPPYSSPSTGLSGLPTVKRSFQVDYEVGGMSSRGVSLSLLPHLDSNMNRALPNNNISRLPVYSRIPASVVESAKAAAVSPDKQSSAVQQEACNETVIQRLTALSKMFQDTQQDEPSPEAGTLSLPDTNTAVLLEGIDPSSSDADTPSGTPLHSPMQKLKSPGKLQRAPTMLKPSDSSFGLHSPDLFPSAGGGSCGDMQDIIKRFQEDPRLPFAEGTLYLDPDIIDLTMIPPPVTPEDETLKPLTTISEPPTPFADREPLENELQGQLERRDPPAGRLGRFQARQNGRNSAKYDYDVDNVLSQMRDPLTTDDISGLADDFSAYIIPPPPETVHNSNTMAILQKLNEAREEISQVMRGDSSETGDEKDCGLAEVRVRFEQRQKESPRQVKDFQRQLSTGNNSEPISLYTGAAAGKTTPDLSPSSSHSSGYGSLKSIVEINAAFIPSKVPPSAPWSDPRSGNPTALSFTRFGSFKLNVDDDDIPPPPPPPRNSGIRTTFNRGNVSPKKTESKLADAPVPSSLVKSSSQGDLLSEKLTASGLPKKTSVDRLKGKTFSTSSESLQASRSVPQYCSKLSINSSNDSIGSNASVATVKAAAGSLPDERGQTTPPLPPRGSPTRVVMNKPPSSPSHRLKQESSATRAGQNSSSPKRSSCTAVVDNTPESSPSAGSNTKPPALPTRLRKPGSTSPTPKSPQKSQAGTQRTTAQLTSDRGHYAVPQNVPSSLEQPKASIIEVRPNPSEASPKRLHSLTSSPNRDGSPGRKSRLPRPQFSGSPPSPALPAASSSPKLGQKKTPSRVISASTKSANRKDGSLDSESFDQDSLDDGCDMDFGLLCQEVETRINRAVAKLNSHGSKQDQSSPRKQDTRSSREQLIAESRHLVTASKLFVKSVTESSQVMSESLMQCVSTIERLVHHAEAICTTEQGKELVPKVGDVSMAYVLTVRAACDAYGKDIADPAMSRLMTAATSLAAVLTVLMRSLRP